MLPYLWPMFPQKLIDKLQQREAGHALRTLQIKNGLIDFSSNDYLGFSASETIFARASQLLQQHELQKNGATGSRLLSGNHALYTATEAYVAKEHRSEAALLFNSGYDANIGFFGSVPQRGDLILYDELIHASIRDGVGMSAAKAYKFKHNNIQDLQHKYRQFATGGEVYVVTESVFSMDGDIPDLQKFVNFCNECKAHLVVDEAHAVGIFKGGLVEQAGLEKEVFARIITFGKAVGCHGAAVLGSEQLKSYLLNFARSFVYTTALPPHAVATIYAAYEELDLLKERLPTHPAVETLHNNIQLFKTEITENHLSSFFISSNSAIHCCIIKGNVKVRQLAIQFQEKGFDVKPIVSPTVPKGKERLRFCLHSFNTPAQIEGVVKLLATFIA